MLFAPVVNANGGGNNFEFQVDNLVTNAVPEPSVAALLALGLLGAGMGGRRRA